MAGVACRLKMRTNEFRNEPGVFTDEIDVIPCYIGTSRDFACRELTMVPKVIAVVLNYNRPADTIECALSLQQCRYENFQVLIVDNGSTDGSVASIRQAIPDVEVVETGKNLGFAGGNNLGFSQAVHRGPDYVLLLNNDTVVEQGFLTPLIDALEHDRTAAAAGGTICYYPDKQTVWFAGGKFNPWRASSFPLHMGGSVSQLPATGIESVTFLTGCMMLVRASVVQSVGLFDERFYMYFEDAEFSLRLIAKGYRLLYVPHSRIYHKVRHKGDTPFTVYYSVRNRLLFVNATMHGWKLLAATLYVHVVAFFKLARWMILRQDLCKAAWMGLEDYSRDVLFEGRGTSLK